MATGTYNIERPMDSLHSTLGAFACSMRQLLMVSVAGIFSRASKWRTRCATCFILLAGIFLTSSGCTFLNGIHLYNNADDKIATEALTSFKDAKIDQTVVEERNLQESLLARELAGSDRLADASRDAVLLAALGGPN